MPILTEQIIFTNQKKIMIILYILGVIAGTAILILLIGLLLPKERIVSRKGHFNASPEELYNMVTNNQDWQYRRSLKNLTILSEHNGLETWDETSKNGTVIRFQTKEKRPYSFYSFEMRSNIFTGYWTGHFQPDEQGKTIFTATEYIRIRNPFIKTLSYLFFNIGKLMDEYQNDLRERVAL